MKYTLNPGTPSPPEKVWVRMIGQTVTRAAALAVDQRDGSINVCGTTFGALDSQPYGGGSDMFMLRYSGAGVKLWLRTFGSTNASIVIDPLVAVAVGGTGTGPGILLTDIQVVGYTTGDKPLGRYAVPLISQPVCVVKFLFLFAGPTTPSVTGGAASCVRPALATGIVSSDSIPVFKIARGCVCYRIGDGAR